MSLSGYSTSMFIYFTYSTSFLGHNLFCVQYQNDKKIVSFNWSITLDYDVSKARMAKLYLIHVVVILALVHALESLILFFYNFNLILNVD